MSDLPAALASLLPDGGVDDLEPVPGHPVERWMEEGSCWAVARRKLQGGGHRYECRPVYVMASSESRGGYFVIPMSIGRLSVDFQIATVEKSGGFACAVFDTLAQAEAHATDLTTREKTLEILAS